VSTAARPVSAWRLEWRLAAAEPTLRGVLLAFVALAGLAAWTGVSHARTHRAELEAAATLHAQRYDSLAGVAARFDAGDRTGWSPWSDPRLPHVIGGGRGGRLAILPPQPLGAIAIGQSDLLPSQVQVTTASALTSSAAEETENPLALLTGRLDLAFVLVVVFPLLVLAATFNVAAGEREGGTLGLLLAQPVSPRGILGRKLAARGIGVILATLLATGAVAAAVGALATPGQFALLLAVVAAYGVFWLGVGIAVNGLGRNSGTSAMAALAAWLTVVVVAPAVFGAAVALFAPAPSRMALMTELRAASNAANARGEALLQKYYLDHPEMMAGGESGEGGGNFAARSLLVAEEIDAVMAPTMAEFDRRVEQQLALADRWRFTSPALVAHAALLDLAGTSPARHRDFSAQVRRFHGEWRAFLTPRAVRGEHLSAATLRDSLPRFAYVEESFDTVFARVAPGLALLLAAGAMLALWGMSRLGQPAERLAS
jgi:ABC-2 type transport system permease protein